MVTGDSVTWGGLANGLIGAVVGGLLATAATIVTARSVLKGTIKHERKLARDAELAERRRFAAEQLLNALSLVQDAVPNVFEIRAADPTKTGWVNGEWAGDTARRALNELSRTEFAVLPFVEDDRVCKRWSTLRTLVGRHAYSDPEPPMTRGEAQQIVDDFVQYVRDSIAAYIEGERMPESTQPPVIHRRTVTPWERPERPAKPAAS